MTQHLSERPLSGICATVAQIPGRGRPATEYWLTKKQAAFLAMKSETDQAVDVTIAVIEVFDAATSGRLSAPESTPALPPPAPVEEPPFCKDCAARRWWNAPFYLSREGLPLIDRPLDRADLDVIRDFRRAVDSRVKVQFQELAEKASVAVRQTLGLSEPTSPPSLKPAPRRRVGG